MSDEQGSSSEPASSPELKGGSESAGSAPEVRGTDAVGCFPAVMAASVLMGIAMFITFAFATWLIFQKRGDLAVRTIRATIVSELEQSRLDAKTKSEVISQLRFLADDIEAGRVEDKQAVNVLQQLLQSPLLRWGDLTALDEWVKANGSADEAASFHRDCTRFFRAAELGKANAADLQDILAPVSEAPPGAYLYKLKTEIEPADWAEVQTRCRIIAKRAEVPDQVFDDVLLTTDH